MAVDSKVVYLKADADWRMANAKRLSKPIGPMKKYTDFHASVRAVVESEVFESLKKIIGKVSA